MSDNRFWIFCWTLVTVVILGTVGTIGGCVFVTNSRNALIVSEAVSNGVDPMRARCALLIGGSSQVTAAEAAICAATSKEK